MTPKFNIGYVASTPGALKALNNCGDELMISKLLSRHINGDWGDLDEEDKARNNAALVDGSRIFSSYLLPPGNTVKIWVITEAVDGNIGIRRATTFLLPSEY